MSGSDLLWMLEWSHGLLERRVVDCPDDAFHAFLPNASIASIAVIYAHAVLTEDNYVRKTIRGAAPLFEWMQVEIPRALTDQVIFHTIEHASEIAALRCVQGA